jgi:hypothetical protein
VENTIVVLPGDFVAPSLLSSLDRGKGMIDMMNRVGVNYVCFGIYIHTYIGIYIHTYVYIRMYMGWVV